MAMLNNQRVPAIVEWTEGYQGKLTDPVRHIFADFN